MELRERIRKVLSDRRRRAISTKRRTRAAVLVPLFEKGGRYYVLFTKRTDRVKHHKGDISFPGGVVDEGDEDMEATALRETFVAEIAHPYPFSINEEEIEELIEIPLKAFLDQDRWIEEIYPDGNKKVSGYRFEYEGRIIWGATARIMRQFLDALFGDKPGV